MSILPWLMDHTGGAVLYRLGKAGRLTVAGRTTGRPRTIQCQFKAREDGTIIVGSKAGRQWPANLAVARTCRFGVYGRPRRWYEATVLEGPARAAAVAALIGGAGRGRAAYSGLIFELRPALQPAPSA